MPLKKLCYLVTSPGTFQQERGNGLSSTDCQSATGPRLPAILKSKKDWCSELAVVKTPEESPSDSQLDAMSELQKQGQKSGMYGETHTNTAKWSHREDHESWDKFLEKLWFSWRT